MSRFINNAEVISFSNIEIKGQTAIVGPIEEFQYKACCKASEILAEEIDIHIPVNPKNPPFLEFVKVEGDLEIRQLSAKGLTKSNSDNSLFLEFTTNAVSFENRRSTFIHNEFRDFFFRNFLKNSRISLENFRGRNPLTQIISLKNTLQKFSKQKPTIFQYCELQRLFDPLERSEKELMTIRKALQSSVGPSRIPETLLIWNLHKRREKYAWMKQNNLDEYVPELDHRLITLAIISYGIWTPLTSEISLNLLVDEGIDRVKAAIKRSKKRLGSPKKKA